MISVIFIYDYYIIIVCPLSLIDFQEYADFKVIRKYTESYDGQNKPAKGLNVTELMSQGLGVKEAKQLIVNVSSLKQTGVITHFYSLADQLNYLFTLEVRENSDRCFSCRSDNVSNIFSGNNGIDITIGISTVEFIKHQQCFRLWFCSSIVIICRGRA